MAAVHAPYPLRLETGESPGPRLADLYDALLAAGRAPEATTALAGVLALAPPAERLFLQRRLRELDA